MAIGASDAVNVAARAAHPFSPARALGDRRDARSSRAMSPAS